LLLAEDGALQIPPTSDAGALSTPRIAVVDAGTEQVVPVKNVHLKIEEWTAEHRVFIEGNGRPVKLTVRLINYPAWDVRVDGKTARPELLEKTAQMVLPLLAGTHRVEIHLRRTWDRSAGAALSALSTIGLLGFVFLRRRTK
jgi:hypothetical protein